MKFFFDDSKNRQEIAIVLVAALLCLLVRQSVGVCVILAVCIAALLAVGFAKRRQRKRRVTALTD